MKKALLALAGVALIQRPQSMNGLQILKSWKN